MTFTWTARYCDGSWETAHVAPSAGLPNNAVGTSVVGAGLSDRLVKAPQVIGVSEFAMTVNAAIPTYSIQVFRENGPLAHWTFGDWIAAASPTGKERLFLAAAATPQVDDTVAYFSADRVNYATAQAALHNLDSGVWASWKAVGPPPGATRLSTLAAVGPRTVRDSC